MLRWGLGWGLLFFFELYIQVYTCTLVHVYLVPYLSYKNPYKQARLRALSLSPAHPMAAPAIADARSSARRLENEIDSKLAQLNRLNSSNSGSSSCSPAFPQLQCEIEVLLQDLAEVNDTMSRQAASCAPGTTATAIHMLQRHREILHDFQQEFNKSKATFRATMERDELLSSVRQDIREHRCASTRASDALLRERNAIHASGRAADEVIDQAQATRDALNAQRSSELAPQV